MAGGVAKVMYGVSIDVSELDLSHPDNLRGKEVDPWLYNEAECVWATWAETPEKAIEIFESLDDDDFYIRDDYQRKAENGPSGFRRIHWCNGAIIPIEDVTVITSNEIVAAIFENVPSCKAMAL